MSIRLRRVEANVVRTLPPGLQPEAGSSTCPGKIKAGLGQDWADTPKILPGLAGTDQTRFG